MKTADGTEHTFHFVGRTAVHGAEMTGEAAKDSFHGLREGGDVVVHYSAKGSEETAEEIDHIGEGGLKASEGTVTHLDRGAKTVTIKTADGSENVFRLTDHAAEDAGKDISEGAEKSGQGHRVLYGAGRPQDCSLFQQWICNVYGSISARLDMLLFRRPVGIGQCAK